MFIGQQCFGISNPLGDISELYINSLGNGLAHPNNTLTFPDAALPAIKSVGGSILYQHDTVNGDSYLIKNSGVYAIMTSLDTGSSNTTNAQGITINEPGPPSSFGVIGDVSAKYVLSSGFYVTASNVTLQTFCVTALSAGDVLRWRDEAENVNNGATNFCYIRITRIV